MTTKLEDASREVAELVINAGILGFCPSYHRGLLNQADLESHHERVRQGNGYGDWLHFTWEQSWGVGCDLEVKWKTAEKMQNGKKVKRSVPECKIGWSSTGRDILSARAAILLYSAVTDLATLIETHFRDRDIETADAAWQRRSKLREEKRAAEVEEFKKTLKSGQEFDLENMNSQEVPAELWEDLDTCSAYRSKESGDCCGAKAKTIVWSGKLKKFIARCGRHSKNVSLSEHDRADESAAA